MSPAELAAGIADVPTKKLQIIEMVQAAADENGRVAYESLDDDYARISEAVAEAREYANGTSELLRSVRWTIEHPLA